MREDFLLRGEAARALYQKTRDLPIIDYHCHLSPKEIYEDVPFDNIGEIWLAGDHYKWRLMRQNGIDEELITGRASWHDKFIRYIETLEYALGNPLYDWSRMELSRYFGIDLPLCRENAEEIWQRANISLREKRLSPRSLIAQSRVELLCTTDDLADDLCYHEKIAAQGSLKAKVLPSFRYDNLLLMLRKDYPDYIQRMSKAAGMQIQNLADLKEAVRRRLAFFLSRGCKCADVGIPYFPDRIAPEPQADESFQAVLAGKGISEEAYLGLLGNLYLYFGKLFAAHDLLSQWHLAVVRNANSALYARCGADSGGDCIGKAVSGKALILMLDRMQQEDALPRTILYTLNPSNLEELATIAGSFARVRLGAAWWFNDHEAGILRQMEVVAQTGLLGSFYGMLTDSRSFLSYARHDYFRRILCSMAGRFVEDGVCTEEIALRLVKRIAYENIRDYFEGEEKSI